MTTPALRAASSDVPVPIRYAGGASSRSVAGEEDSQPDRPCLRYRLDVIGLDIADVARSAGGWLYHRVATGWQVNVLVLPGQDLRPLDILGVRALDLNRELAAPAGDVTGRGLAVGDRAFASDARIRERVLTALQSSLIEVTLWGDRWPVAVNHRTGAVQYVLTGAARAFKAQSLLAAEPGGAPSGSPEVFRSDRKRCLPVESDLIPVD